MKNLVITVKSSEDFEHLNKKKNSAYLTSMFWLDYVGFLHSLADTTQILQFYSKVVGERSDYFTLSILCNLSLLEDQHQIVDL